MKTVLVVDDEKSFLLSLEEGLRHSADFRTITAENGKRAVEALGKNKVDLVVTDLNMPEMDGFQLMAYMLKSCPQISDGRGGVLDAGSGELDAQLLPPCEKPSTSRSCRRASLLALRDGQQPHQDHPAFIRSSPWSGRPAR
jgi:CheY-like chemotaxis protein